MKYSDREITKDFISLIKESSDPNQFTSTYQKAAGDIAGVAADVAADAAGLGILFSAAEALNNVMGSQGAAKIAEMYLSGGPLLEPDPSYAGKSCENI